MTDGRTMKLIFITQDDPFYVRCFFEEFLGNYPFPEEIDAVVIQSPMGKKSRGRLIRQMYDFYGMKDFWKMGLRYAWTKNLNFLGGLFSQTEWMDISALCRVHHINVLYINDLHHPEFLNEIRERGIDLIISVAAPTIFRQELIDLPPLGCINIHHAPLPRYKGMMPNFWQLYHGEKTVGITIHKINPRIDEGEIILQKEVAVIPGESLDGLIKRTKRLGAHCVAEAIEMIRSGGLQTIENRVDQASYFSFPTKHDVRKFRQMGYRLL